MAQRISSFRITDSARPPRRYDVSTLGHIVEASREPSAIFNGAGHVKSVLIGSTLIAFVDKLDQVRVAPRTGPVVVAHNPQRVDRIMLGTRR